MKNDPSDFEDPYLRHFYERTEKTDGPELQGFSPTLQELIQIILFHVQEYVQLRWDAFFTGLEDSKAEEDAIWTRLDKIRRVIRPDDFRRTVDLACIRFGMEVDASLWNVFVHGDETIRRNVANAAGQERYVIAGAFSKEHFAKIHSGEEEFAPQMFGNGWSNRSSVGRRSRAGYSTKWIIGHRSFNLMSRRIKGVRPKC